MVFILTKHNMVTKQIQSSSIETIDKDSKHFLKFDTINVPNISKDVTF